MHLLISFRTSSALQNRQLVIYHYQLEYCADIFVEELTFKNLLIDTLCLIESQGASMSKLGCGRGSGFVATSVERCWEQHQHGRHAQQASRAFVRRILPTFSRR